MFTQVSKYRLSLAVIFALATFLFWFAYSEIGQYTVEKQHPAAQDYCQVASVIKTEISKTATNTSVKLFLEKSVCMHCIDNISIHNTALINFDIEHFYLPYRITPLYLNNSSFLI